MSKEVKKALELKEALIRCRSEQDLTLREVASAIGLTAAGLSNIERGLTVPRRTTLLRLVGFLAARGFRIKEVSEQEVA